jgi:hypothetical protein
MFASVGADGEIYGPAAVAQLVEHSTNTSDIGGSEKAAARQQQETYYSQDYNRCALTIDI